MRIIAYTYCADYHCQECAKKAGMDAPNAFDREGNTPGVVFGTDETPEGGIFCGDCGGKLAAPAGTLRAYTLSELRARASLSESHYFGFASACSNYRHASDNGILDDDECAPLADADGFTFDAFGNPLDGYEGISDYSPDDQAKLLAMQEGGAK